MTYDRKFHAAAVEAGYASLPGYVEDGMTERARDDANNGWIATSEKLPEKPGKDRYEYVECMIFHKGEIKLRPWNCEHLCWDDESHDDFFCDPKEPTHWMPLPAPPAKTGKAGT